MISYLIDVFLCSMVVVAELVGTIILAIVTEVMVYKVFKINLYKNLCKLSRKLDKKVTEMFG